MASTPPENPANLPIDVPAPSPVDPMPATPSDIPLPGTNPLPE